MHNYPQDYIYGIILTTDIGGIDFSQVFPKQEGELRYSLGGTQFVIKWEEDHIPTFITDGSVVPVQTLTHQECLDLMATAEWSEPIE